MVEIIRGKNTFFLNKTEFISLLQSYQDVIVDLGTGDGKFIYELAKKNSQTFFIGIDADRNGLIEYSHKITRKPSKGGLCNVVYLISNVNNLPDDLAEIANEVWIILPWGSLLQAVVLGEAEFIQNISKIAKKTGSIHTFVNYDLQYEANEITKLGLPNLTIEYLETTLAPKYNNYGLFFSKSENLSNEEMTKIPSTWARRLGFGRPRQTIKTIWNKKS